MTSGQKRSWEGAENESNKRLTRDKGEGRDWRDVHLKTEGRKQNSRNSTYEMRTQSRYDSGGRKASEGNYRSRRDSESGSMQEKHRGSRRKERTHSRSPKHKPRSPSKDAEDEKEEGE